MVQECIKLGFFDMPVHEAAAAAVLRVLEAHGTVDIELITGEKAALYQELNAGDIDVFTTLWLPNVHQELSNSASLMQAIGNLYQPSLFLALPKEFQDQIQSVDQLIQSPNIEKQVIVPETVYERFELAFKNYGLFDAGYNLTITPDEEAVKLYNQNIESQAKKLIALYSPSLLEDSDKIYKLVDPKNLLNAEQHAVILIKKELIPSLGEDLIDELAEMTLGNQVIKLMEQAIRVEGMDAHEAAEAWQRGKLVIRT